MALIRSKDTGPEVYVRRLLHRLGYRFRLHRSDLPGKPDIVLPGRRAVIFVHGCFWHHHSDPSCKLARIPKSRADYWRPKLERNAARDTTHRRALELAGWSVLEVWECQLRRKEDLEPVFRGFLG
jgi:DNA mismatch endonuclease (patch repair protein)